MWENCWISVLETGVQVPPDTLAHGTTWHTLTWVPLTHSHLQSRWEYNIFVKVSEKLSSKRPLLRVFELLRICSGVIGLTPTVGGLMGTTLCWLGPFSHTFISNDCLWEWMAVNECTHSQSSILPDSHSHSPIHSQWLSVWIDGCELTDSQTHPFTQTVIHTHPITREWFSQNPQWQESNRCLQNRSSTALSPAPQRHRLRNGESSLLTLQYTWHCWQKSPIQGECSWQDLNPGHIHDSRTDHIQLYPLPHWATGSD